jgi:TetR/AcrR family fatty acid metabolism transcriptional regulator
MPRVSREDRRDRILDAATRVFAKRGFFAAQVADVAKRAGVAAGTVYLYFKSKDDLLMSLFERTMTAAVAEAREATRAPADPLTRLRQIARLHLARLGGDRNLAIVFQIELRQSAKFMARLSTSSLRDYLGLLRELVSEGQAKALVRPEINPTLAAKVIFGALDEMATNWILSERDYKLEDEADAVMDLLVGGLVNSTVKNVKSVEEKYLGS